MQRSRGIRGDALSTPVGKLTHRTLGLGWTNGLGAANFVIVSAVSTRSGPSLTELARDAGAGDVAAWNAIVDRFAGMVWAIARRHRLSDADAADVSQTTWLRLVEHLDRIEDPDRIGGWLATTARHESLRVLRVAERQMPTPHEDFVDLRADGRTRSRCRVARG